VLGGAVVALSGVVFLIGVLAGRPPLLMAITGVSLVVAAVPESLPAVVTLSLALAARRMAENRAIPRRLHAAETLGSVTVVASDKTGTLTEGRMAVQRAVDAGGREYDVAGYGYEPTGTISGADATEALPAALLELARAGLLCNDATIKAPTPELPDWAAVGDPLEAALVVFAARCGLDPDAERATWRASAAAIHQQARHGGRPQTGRCGVDDLQGRTEAVLARRRRWPVLGRRRRGNDADYRCWRSRRRRRRRRSDRPDTRPRPYRDQGQSGQRPPGGGNFAEAGIRLC
jgi:hypothetical protein